MKLHIFNPEHEIALAENKESFTLPHIVRRLRADLAYIPALWAEDGDYVLVEDAEAARESYRRQKAAKAEVSFVTEKDLYIKNPGRVDIQPWGWDKAVAERVTAIAPEYAAAVPHPTAIDTIREVANRGWAAENLLPQLTGGAMGGKTVGEAFVARSAEKAAALVVEMGDCVVKSPFSSSGRGLRYICAGNVSEPHNAGWIANTVRRQGSIIVEPRYRKAMDFGMEFRVAKGGVVEYCGLSVFGTSGGSYTGNVVASEQYKESLVTRYLPAEILGKARTAIQDTIAMELGWTYRGCFGVDMMVVCEKGEYRLHPCVEMNLRMTMGHVAIMLSGGGEDTPARAMSVAYNAGRFKLRIADTFENIIDNSVIPANWP